MNTFITEELTQDLMFCLILFHFIMFAIRCVSPLEHKLLSIN